MGQDQKGKVQKQAEVLDHAPVRTHNRLNRAELVDVRDKEEVLATERGKAIIVADNKISMPRRKRCRKIGGNPNAVYFKPNGIPKRFLEEVCLDIDEWEAIRLKDFSELDQNDCAKKMKVSQPTFHRIITSAHKKIADSLINGKAIKLMS